jgi:hypothetical protein
VAPMHGPTPCIITAHTPVETRRSGSRANCEQTGQPECNAYMLRRARVLEIKRGVLSCVKMRTRKCERASYAKLKGCVGGSKRVVGKSRRGKSKMLLRLACAKTGSQLQSVGEVSKRATRVSQESRNARVSR